MDNAQLTGCRYSLAWKISENERKIPFCFFVWILSRKIRWFVVLFGFIEIAERRHDLAQ
jgi:hypothetical protein